MNISALSTTTSAKPAMRIPEPLEAPGPVKDGDADDKGIAKQVNSSAALPKDVGASVDSKA
jgi:hypothetical protein